MNDFDGWMSAYQAKWRKKNYIGNTMRSSGGYLNTRTIDDTNRV